MIIWVLMIVCGFGVLLVAADYRFWKIYYPALAEDDFLDKCRQSDYAKSNGDQRLVGHVWFASDDKGNCKEILGVCHAVHGDDGRVYGVSDPGQNYELDAPPMACSYLGHFFATRTPLQKEF